MPLPIDEEALDPKKRSSSLSDRVYSILYSRIVSGQYVAEQRLPSENDLAVQFNVSRPVIREALERLRSAELVVSRQGAGSFVSSRWPSSRTTEVVGYSPVETIADIQRCFEFRLTIEPEAASLAAARHNEAALAKIRVSVEAMEHATDNRQHRSNIDFAFHLAVAEATNNHYYVASMLALREHITNGLKLHGKTSTHTEPRRLDAVLDELGGIYAAIRDRDREAARTLMHRHVAGSRDRLFEGRFLDLSLSD